MSLLNTPPGACRDGVRAPASASVLASRTCPICRTAPINHRQKVCSGRCSGGPKPAAEGRDPTGARRGDPGAARGRTEEAEGQPVMERRIFLAMASGSLLAAPLAVEAQPADKIYR